MEFQSKNAFLLKTEVIVWSEGGILNTDNITSFLAKECSQIINTKHDEGD